MTGAGAVLFARYAYAPNELGYCGPAETQALFELGVTGHTDSDVPAIARRFSGAWPYASVLADLAGIADPLDERVMRAYWTGSALLNEIDRTDFAGKLLEVIAAQAGHYWQHLSTELVPEAAPTHGFHVFGVYPWTRLLAQLPEQALHVLDNCRIRWGRVIELDGDHVMVRSRRLTWNGVAIGLAAPAPERVRLTVGGRSFVPDASAGDQLTLHWDSVCERLDASRLDRLRRGTAAQLRVTNERLARERADAAGVA